MNLLTHRVKVPTSLLVTVAMALGLSLAVGVGDAHSSPSALASAKWQPVSATVLSELTSVPSSVFDQVAISSGSVTVTPPYVLNRQPLLSSTSASGAVLPEVLFMGAEYCPYCAAQRWSTIIALSRFGTFHNLGDIASASQEVYPSTASFTFVKASYVSKYLVFKSVELYTNVFDSSTGFYSTLQKPTALENAEFTKYDNSKFISGMPAADDQSIPFITLGNRFVVVGASYSPAIVHHLSRDAIAAGLSHPTNSVTRAIISSANFQTADLCVLTKGMPVSVCQSSGVRAAATALHL
jgi:hypothetical protein